MTKTGRIKVYFETRKSNKINLDPVEYCGLDFFENTTRYGNLPEQNTPKN